MHFTLNRDALAYVPAKLKLFVSPFIILSETKSAMAGRKFDIKTQMFGVALPVVVVDQVLEQR